MHLSEEYQIAVSVGTRHGKPVILRVSAAEMEKDGFPFYRSVNGVWLTKEVPVRYFEQIADQSV